MPSTTGSYPTTSSYPTSRSYPTTSSYPTSRSYPTTSSYPTSRSYPTTSSYPTSRSYPTTSTGTTAPTVTGVSVCLRYLTDCRSVQPFFRLGSASSYSLYLDLQDNYNYILRLNSENPLTFQPNKMFGAPTTKLWTSLCLTVDNRKKVAQVFSGSKMSIRKLMPAQLFWSGEPVIEFSSFDGQLTDVQVWDYPITYKDVLSYTERDHYRQRGSVITWSSINYSLRGNALLEDSF
ncbi:jeltraxin-like [Nelusetta ayraudi]|uniref:jeltraxin-like n=1 Tax=Nelusetta ayraudi TaxID=303726 RepID=UPI003F6F22F6